MAHDLLNDSFIIALKNFVNRRGVPQRMRSDNGKNFEIANVEANFVKYLKLVKELSANGNEWIFDCAANPSEGGLQERMVQCVKKVLRQTIKKIETENIVNFRPFTHLPVTINEEEPLTPDRFLIG